MPIRTKKDVQYVINCPNGQTGGSACSTVSVLVDVPIRDWSINPPQLNKVWQIGTPTPGQLFQDISFPELEFVYTSYPNFRFKIKKNLTAGSVDFVAFSSTKLIGDTFNQVNLISERVYCNFQNFDNLSAGTHVMPITIEAYGLDSGNQEHFVESFYTEISVTVQPGNGISTNKNIYNIQYNIADGLLSGDNKIIALVNDQVTTSVSDNFISLLQQSVNGQRHLMFQNNSVLQNKPVGNYTGTVTIQLGSATKTVAVNLEVINDTTQFYVDPLSFKFSLQKSLSESKTFSSNISNPNGLNIIVESNPSFIANAVINNNVLTFTTVNSSTLAIGNYSGEIILKSGNVIKKIVVDVSVLKGIIHDFSGQNYYFAKDPNKVVLSKTTNTSTYVKMNLKMFFNGFGQQFQENEEYAYPFFNGSVEIYPGQEVQDFFIRAKNISTSLNPVNQYHLALVEMTFEELDDSDQVLSTFILNNKYFAPGRKPKCFPLFTNYAVRRTFSDSIIKISTDRLSLKEEMAQLNAQYTIDPPVNISKFTVDQFTFLRNAFNPTLKKNIITNNLQSFIPFPDPEKVVHIEWENDNLVFDWFSAAGDVKIVSELDIIAGESDEYIEEKFDSIERKILTINTGWVLYEEIDLISDLLKSRLCFIYSEGTRYKAFPITTKNELKNSVNNTFSMDMDFKLLIDEE